MRMFDPECSIFWIQTTDDASFEAAYWEIGQELKLPGMPRKPGRLARHDASPGQFQGPSTAKDFKTIVKAALEGDHCSRWLLVIDNMNDPTVFQRTVKPHLPFAHHGSILYTTRAEHIFSYLSGQDTMRLQTLDAAAGNDMLRYDLKATQQVENDTVKSELLENLGYNPLAIRTAISYMRRFNKNESQYLHEFRESDASCSRLLSQDFEDPGRYDNVSNPVARTWWVSFQQIKAQEIKAARLFEIISFLGPQSIPKSLLPDAGPEQDEALGTLVSIGFIEIHDGEEPLIDAHRLVQLAMRNYLSEKHVLGHTAFLVAERLDTIFRRELADNWVPSLPHYESAIKLISAYWEGLSAKDRFGLFEMLMPTYSFKQERDLTERCLFLVTQLASLYTWTPEQQLTETWERRGLFLAQQCLPRADESRIEMKMELADTLLIIQKVQEAESLAREAATDLLHHHGEEHLWINRCDWIIAQAMVHPNHPKNTQDSGKQHLKEHLTALLNRHRWLKNPQERVTIPKHDVLQAVERLCIETLDYKYREVFALARRFVDHWKKKSPQGIDYANVLETAGNIALRDKSKWVTATEWLKECCQVTMADFESKQSQEPLTISPFVSYSDALHVRGEHDEGLKTTQYALDRSQEHSPSSTSTAFMLVLNGISRLHCNQNMEACTNVSLGIANLTWNGDHLHATVASKVTRFARVLQNRAWYMEAEHFASTILEFRAQAGKLSADDYHSQ